MGTDEHDILGFLKQFDTFVSPIEVAKRAGGKRRFMADRNWARPVLHRMLLEGLLDANEYGHYRFKPDPAQNKKAERINYYSLGYKSYLLDDDQPFSVVLAALRER